MCTSGDGVQVAEPDRVPLRRDQYRRHEGKRISGDVVLLRGVRDAAGQQVANPTAAATPRGSRMAPAGTRGTEATRFGDPGARGGAGAPVGVNASTVDRTGCGCAAATTGSSTG